MAERVVRYCTTEDGIRIAYTVIGERAADPPPERRHREPRGTRMVLKGEPG